jgi:2Fe-2S ferredoxin
MTEADNVDAGASGEIVVQVEPSGVTIRVRPGERLMAAAERQGYRWPTICHGQAVCTACFIILNGNTESFEPPSELELKGLELFEGRSFYEGKTVRLACQARPISDTVVTKRGVRPA